MDTPPIALDLRGLPPDLVARLERIAARVGQSREACLCEALRDYVESWEDHHRNLDALRREEARPVLRAINE